jgi:hypothetical protein
MLPTRLTQRKRGRTAVWVALALVFAGGLRVYSVSCVLTGYVIEESLSIDNILSRADLQCLPHSDLAAPRLFYSILARSSRGLFIASAPS